MKNSRHENGFTLIELLTVMTIIGILAALVLGVTGHAYKKAKINRAKAEIAALENALESYKNDNGYYPASAAPRVNPGPNSVILYYALTSGPKQFFPFKPNQIQDGGGSITVVINCINSTLRNVMVVDPFGKPYEYFCKPRCGAGTDGQTNAATFDLWSYGPDGLNDEGTNDDITNWRQ